MKRLFTFGCSFTRYHYPTWAHFLSLDFDYFENWGLSGIGNRAIAERVAECHAKNKFTKDDVVIVQWSTHLRYDYAILKYLEQSWQPNGGIFNPAALQNVFNNSWHEIFFDEEAFIMHELNHIILVNQLLNSVNCTYFMTSIGDINKLGTDLIDEIEHLSIKKPDSIDKNYPNLKFYLNNIKNINWIEPLINIVKENPELAWVWRMGPGEGTLGKDRHPSPRQHVKWLNNYLRPKLKLEPKKEDEEWLSLLDKISVFSNNRYNKTRELINKIDVIKESGFHLDYWPPEKSWNTKCYDIYFL